MTYVGGPAIFVAYANGLVTQTTGGPQTWFAAYKIIHFITKNMIYHLGLKILEIHSLTLKKQQPHCLRFCISTQRAE